MTKRLRELEARVERLPPQWTGHKAFAELKGYRMALEDLAPVLTAAREVVHSNGNEADVHALERTLAVL